MILATRTDQMAIKTTGTFYLLLVLLIFITIFIKSLLLLLILSLLLLLIIIFIILIVINTTVIELLLFIIITDQVYFIAVIITLSERQKNANGYLGPLVKRGKKAAECENPSPLQPLGVPRELPWQKRKQPAAEEKQESAEENAKRARLLTVVKPMFANQGNKAHLTIRESFFFDTSAADSTTTSALTAK